MGWPIWWRGCPPPMRRRRAAFARMNEAMPAFSPASLLDVGAGPGTAAWAARDAWPSLQAITLARAQSRFSATWRHALLPQAQNHRRAILAQRKPRADLVTAGYVLAELPEKAAAPIARRFVGRGGRHAGPGRARHAGGLCPHPRRARRPDRGRRACRGALHP